MADYIKPNDPESLRAFIVALLDELPSRAAAVGVTASEQSQLASLGNAAVGGIDNAVSAENAYGSAIADQKRLIGDFVTYLRPLVRRIKENTGYTDTIGEALGIVAASTAVDEASIKPVITLTAHIGFVRVRIQRKGAKSVQLFCRRSGQSEWTSLGRVVRASHDDTSALSQPGVPEIKEYMAQAYIGDDPVGQPSDIKVVVFAGNIAA
jgi:hypothetical protein